MALTLDFRFWRGLMLTYAAEAGLKYEEHFEPGSDQPLADAGQRFLGRITNHMHAKNVIAVKAGKVQPFKGVEAGTKILTAEVRRALLPDRPSWQSEIVRIVRQDAANPDAAYYTQGPQRWQGVRAVFGVLTAAPKKFRKLLSGDCSAEVSRVQLAAWQSHLGFIPHDFVNDCRWTAGYTGSIGDTCRRLGSREKIQIGDMPLYGRGDFHHVMIVIDPETRECGNHGTMSGPNIRTWNYNETPAMFVRPNYPHQEVRA